MTAAVVAFAAISLAGAASGQSAEQIEAYEQRIEEQSQQLEEMRRELDELKAAVEQQSETGAEPAEDSEAAEEGSSASDARFVFSGNENVTVTLRGRVHRMLMHVDDGANSDLFYTDSDQGPTMLRVDAIGRLSDSATVGGTIETGILQNRPLTISQDNPDSGTSVSIRLAEGFVDSSRYGKLSFGRGFASAWMTPEIDLSGTQFASLLSVGMLAPGMKFVNAANNSLSNVRVLNHFADIERLLLIDRFRYDSPIFGPGLQLSGSVANDGRSDVAVRVKPPSNGSWTFVGGGSYQNRPFEGIDRRVDGAVSARHERTGLNLTIGASRDRLSDGRDATTWLVKGGWLADILEVGRTAFSIDYYVAGDLQLEGDDAKSFGLFAVQKVSAIGLDVYVGHRRYDVTRSDIDLRRLDLTVLGLAFNF